ncbi:hypothetical protein TWF506_008111 [Arthrobotrys conoides]|uniref:Uncharacterized protein n=1 Tax=Arthrobotrys conoides TaxID=74498 RepID=A0AAN8N5D6_9PEZI
MVTRNVDVTVPNHHSPGAETKEEPSQSDGVTLQKQLNVYAGSGSTVELVLDIIHHRPARNPKSVSIEKLHSISSFCRNYELQDTVFAAVMLYINAIQPLSLATIATPWCSDDKHHHMSYDCPKWLWVAEAFRIERIRWECMKNLVFHGLKDPDEDPYSGSRQNLLIPVCSPKHRGYLSRGMPYLQDIYAQRDIFIHRLINTIVSEHDALKGASIEGNFLCKGSQDLAVQRICDDRQCRQVISLKRLFDIPDDPFPRLHLDNHTLSEIFKAFRKLKSCEPDFMGKPGQQAACKMSLYFSEAVGKFEGDILEELWWNAIGKWAT